MNDYIFTKRPETTEDRLRFLTDMLHDWESIEVAGEGIGPRDDYWLDYLKGPDGREVEKKLALSLKKDPELSDYYLSCCKEQAMLYPYSQRLTESALRAVYPQQQILSVSLSKDEQEKTTIDGLHVVAVAGFPITEDVYLFAEDMKGVPYAFSADTAASYDGGVVTKSQEAQATLYKFGIHATLQKKAKKSAAVSR